MSLHTFKKILYPSITVVFVLMLGTAIGGQSSELKINPNNLPLCPKPDYSKNTDFERIAKWHNCWGKYKVQFFKNFKGDILESEWKNGGLHGQGAYYYLANNELKGDVYVGTFKNGYKHGRGIYTHANGDRYIGEFENDKIEGQGTYTYSNGKKYEGNFKNGSYEGKGKLIWADGTEFSGDWKNNELEGIGAYLYIVDGRRVGYIGEWKNGRYEGFGIKVTNAGVRYEGVWSSGTFIRSEKVNLAGVNRNIFEQSGRFENDEPNKKISSQVPELSLIDLNLFLIKPKFDHVEPFSEGYAAVRIGDGKTGKWGFVDKSKEVAIDPQFDSVYGFSEDLAAVLVSNGGQDKWGFIDKKGNFVINPQFDYAHSFHEGYAAVRIGSWESGKWGFIDKKGKLLINPQYDYVILGFYDGLAAVRLGSWEFGKWGFIDKQGKIAIKFQFSNVLLPFEEGLAAVQIGKDKEGKWGVIDRNGNFVITPFSEEPIFFSEGLAAIRIGDDKTGKWGFINKKREFVISPQFSETTSFSEGFAAVRIGDNKSGKWGFIDKTGNFVINPNFKNARPFKEGLASVQSENGKYGYIDKQGDFVVSPYFENEYSAEFNLASDFNEGLAASCIKEKSDKKCGFISKNFIQAIPGLQKSTTQLANEKKSRKISLQISSTEPEIDGGFTIEIQTNADTASLKINGEEQGGRSDGKYSVKKIARAGGETQFTIVATDINGNNDAKTISVSRPIFESKPLVAALNPTQVKKQPERDAVAIIIGIAEYKNLPRADFANDDARVFYDYAIRALGIKTENIKLMVDANADDVAIYQAFKTWLPSRVRPTTDVYVYYSGHGLPAEDGKGLYLLPQRAHRDLIEKTAISQQEINGFIQAARPRSVTIFLDSCYSGLARSGETLVASARPVRLKTESKLFPENFAVITASQNDQISSSNPDLQHGIFSYYLMKGMEGDADSNKDGKITLGEMQAYLVENVGRQAAMMNRKQEPQLVGDVNRVLVGR